jgi:hypothetical protein
VIAEGPDLALDKLVLTRLDCHFAGCRVEDEAPRVEEYYSFPWNVVGVAESNPNRPRRRR